MLSITTRILNAWTTTVLEMYPRTKDFGFSIQLPYRLISSRTFLLANGNFENWNLEFNRFIVNTLL